MDDFFCPPLYWKQECKAAEAHTALELWVQIPARGNPEHIWDKMQKRRKSYKPWSTRARWVGHPKERRNYYSKHKWMKKVITQSHKTTISSVNSRKSVRRSALPVALQCLVQGLSRQLRHKESTYFHKCYLESENSIRKLIDCNFFLIESKHC